MLQIKKFSTVTALVISGLLFFSFPVFAHGGGHSGQQCGNYMWNNSNLSKEQANKVDKIQDKYSEKISPIRQKLYDVRSEAYKYSNGENVDISKVKEYNKQIRELQGKIDDLRIDERAEINKVLPENLHSNYLNQCYGYNNGGMANGYGMMNGGMMGNGMMSHMMNGSGMMGGNGMGGMMNGYWNNN